MNILIGYSSQEGQTRKIAQFLGEVAKRLGHGAQLVNLDASGANLELGTFDRVILAGSVHERRHAPGFESFITQNADTLHRLKTLLLSVSLNAAFAEGLEDAQDYLDEMKLRTNFTPTAEALIAGAVRRESYDAYAEHVVRDVLLQGRDTLEASREFTDWEALEATVSGFLERV
jgi:menaquinone-dependent protoporphyrinogen oxidase